MNPMYYDYTGDISYTSTREIAFGVFAGIDIWRGMRVNIEPLYTKKGIDIKYNHGNVHITTFYEYLELPITIQTDLRYKRINIYGIAGPNIAISWGNPEFSFYCVKSYDFLADIGAGLGYTLDENNSIFIETRKSYGLINDIKNAFIITSFKSNDAKICVGFSYLFGK